MVLRGGKRRLSAPFAVAQKVWRLQIADIKNQMFLMEGEGIF